MKRLSQIEREWFVQGIGGANTYRSLNDIKRQYFGESTGAGGSQISLEELEKRWLRKVVSDNGDTVQDPWSPEDLWRRALIANSGTPTTWNNENKLRFYLGVTPGNEFGGGGAGVPMGLLLALTYSS